MMDGDGMFCCWLLFSVRLASNEAIEFLYFYLRVGTQRLQKKKAPLFCCRQHQQTLFLMAETRMALFPHPPLFNRSL